MQGGTEAEAGALAAGDAAALEPKDQALLEFVRKITFAAAEIDDADAAAVRQAGWSDPEIAEAVYVAAFFAMMNRVADAFGI